jgi:NTE family protein
VTAPIERPDVLVLGVGGVLGEAWLSGVLAGITATSGIDFRECPTFVGTSAGSIVAAYLAAGHSPPVVADRPEADPEVEAAERGLAAAVLRGAGRAGLAATLPLAPFLLAAATPGGALARAAVLSRTPAGRIALDDLRARIEQLGGRFDGRLRVVAVDRGSGKRVVFGAPDAPEATVGDAVVASCAVPSLMRPAVIGGRTYVDGGVWSPTNLDAAPVRPGEGVLCLVPTARLGASRSSPARALRLAWRSTTALEVAALRRRGADVRVVGPDDEAAAAMGDRLMDPQLRERAVSAGHRQGRRLAAAR